MQLTARAIIGSILVLIIGFFSFQTIQQSKSRQLIVIQNAEINNVKYGLLSIHEWKRKVSNILSKKIEEFELTTENRNELRASIQSGMHDLLDELDLILEQKRREGGFWVWAGQKFIEFFMVSMADLRKSVPAFTEIILDELDKPESREKLKLLIQRKVDELLYETIGEEDLSQIQAIAQNNGCSNFDDCRILLKSQLTQADNALNQKAIFIVGLAILAFLIILVKNKNVLPFEFLVLIALCSILLYAGLNNPMIDIDARIENFKFSLMGEPLEFNNQVLFFQSKSIFEVVSVLVTTNDYQSILVGVLIFMFSVVFPLLKLLASFALVNKPSWYNNKIVSFLALKSGKWSMADVMVVAIFMAYIGFRGVIGSQLKKLENLSSSIEIFTTDNSSFGIGFILFLTFCIAGLVLASVIEKHLNKKHKMLNS